MTTDQRPPAPSPYDRLHRDDQLRTLFDALDQQRKLLGALDDALHAVDWQSGPSERCEALSRSVALLTLETCEAIWRLSEPPDSTTPHAG